MWFVIVRSKTFSLGLCLGLLSSCSLLVSGLLEWYTGLLEWWEHLLTICILFIWVILWGIFWSIINCISWMDMGPQSLINHLYELVSGISFILFPNVFLSEGYIGWSILHMSIFSKHVAIMAGPTSWDLTIVLTFHIIWAWDCLILEHYPSKPFQVTNLADIVCFSRHHQFEYFLFTWTCIIGYVELNISFKVKAVIPQLLRCFWHLQFVWCPSLALWSTLYQHLTRDYMVPVVPASIHYHSIFRRTYSIITNASWQDSWTKRIDNCFVPCIL